MQLSLLLWHCSFGMPLCLTCFMLCRYVLISVGTMAAYLYSVFSIIYGRVAHGHDYKVGFVYLLRRSE